MLSLVAWAARAQTRGAELVKQLKPTHPDAMLKASASGNVVLIARIDKNGSVQDARPIFKTNDQFVGPALAAVKAWSFRPAMRGGRAIDIAANIVFPFRIRDAQGQAAGHETGPTLLELAIFPADASGKKTSPEGFPIHQGSDARLRVETSINLPADPNPHPLAVRVEASSPSHRKVLVYQDTLPAAPKAKEVKLPFSAPIGPDWEDGVWILSFTADGKPIGGGQFWLARDPSRFDFAAALRQVK
jgi:hypothetical protein